MPRRLPSPRRPQEQQRACSRRSLWRRSISDPAPSSAAEEGEKENDEEEEVLGVGRGTDPPDAPRPRIRRPPPPQGASRGVYVTLARSSAAAATAADADSPFVLAAARTQRKDPLDGLRYYAGGWNISSEHYWASVDFSAAPVFAAAGIWFAVFGIALFLAGCCPGRSVSYSGATLIISLVLLVVFTAAAAVGCVVLYDGQGRFHGSMTATVDYVVVQSGDTVDNLRTFPGFLETAKAAGVGPAMLPADVKGRIDDVVHMVSSASDELAARTTSNSTKIRAALETTRKILIVLAAVMLILAFAGLVFSACGLESLVYVLVFLGWILVAATFVLCGTSGQQWLWWPEQTARPLDVASILNRQRECAEARGRRRRRDEGRVIHPSGGHHAFAALPLAV